jgi:hypothetical protein
VTVVEVAQDEAVGISVDGIVLRSVTRPSLTRAYPGVVLPAGDARVHLYGSGFTNTTTLACKFGAFWGRGV